MPKTKISDYSQTAASNTDINSINLAEGMLPSDVNNAIRELMKQLKDFQVGSQGDPQTVGGNFVVSGTSNLIGTATIDGLIFPTADGTNGQFIKTNGSGTLSFATGASGDVTGPASSTDGNIAAFTGTSGKIIKDSGKVLPSGTIVGTSDSQTLSSKTIHGDVNTLTVDGTNGIGFRKIVAVGTKTGSYTLATGDVGKYVQVGSGGSITIPDATFAEGDAISIFNNTTGAITITCTITTAYIAGTDSDKATVSLATRGVATILFISSTVCVVSGNVT